MERISIMEYLDERGFKHAQRGFGYLIEAIQMGGSDPDILNAITKELYPGIAFKRGVTGSRVERCIRHSIETAEGVSKHVTNSEFIAQAIDALQMEPETKIPLCRLCGHPDKYAYTVEGITICRACGTKIDTLRQERELNKRLFVAEAEAENG